MTNPFQSILNGAPEQTVEQGSQSGRPFVLVKTGLCEAFEAIKAASSCAQLAKKRQQLRGGTYSPDAAIQLMNSHFFVADNGPEVVIARIADDGKVSFISAEQFKLAVANIFVERPSGSGGPIPVEKYWTQSPCRHQRVVVFKPGGDSAPNEYNLWQGFGVQPQRGWRKQRGFLRHIREVLCRRDKEKFKYLIRLLAWMVQNPGKHSGVVFVLKSSKQGTGKTTLGNVMLDIFGPHGARIDDKNRLLGQFNDWLEIICFVLLEEATWAGDLKAADKLKSVVTGDTLQVERKFGSCRQVPNRLKAIATTNHDHAVHAGVEDRRHVVYETSDERVGDKVWFDKIYRDLAEGGTGQFLHFLLNVRLGDWHPRQIIRTDETAVQQRMSADSVSQWSQACIEADEIVGMPAGPHGSQIALDLGMPHSAKTLRDAYAAYCRQNGLRPKTQEDFGMSCAEMFGRRIRRRSFETVGTGNRKRRPWGYDVPTGRKWQEKVNARLGIRADTSYRRSVSHGLTRRAQVAR